MTTTALTATVVAVLRDSGAANAWFDDSATDGQCWQIDTSDAWFQDVAEAIVEALELEPVRGPHCPRCGAKAAPLPVSGVCLPCGQQEGWATKPPADTSWIRMTDGNER